MAALLPCACGHFMDPPSLDVALPEHWDTPVKPPSPPVEIPASLQRDWWKAAHDPALDALIGRIEQQNLSLEQARFRLQAARTDVGGNSFLPSFSIEQSTDFEPISVYQQRAYPNIPTNAHLEPTFGGFNKIGPDAKWELPLFGVYKAAEDQANANVAFAEEDIAAIRATVFAEAVTDYEQLRNAQVKEAFLAQIVTSQQQIVKLAHIKSGAGLADDSERIKSEQALEAARAEQAAAQNAITEFTQKLAKLSGSSTPDPGLAATPKAVPVFPVIDITDTPRDVLRNRPDIRKAEQLVISANSDLKLAKSDMYPKLSLEGQFFKINNLIRRPEPETSPAFSFNEAISLPLFDWGRRRANAEAKDAKLAETASAYRETVIGAMTEVQQMMSAYQAAQAQREAATHSEMHAQQLLTHATTLKQQGLSDDIAWENARIAAARAAMEQADAQANEAISLTNLTKGLGGGLAKEEGASHAQKN